MVRWIVARFSPDRVFLFGSHATGRATADIDIDLLVVMPVKRSKAEQEVAILKSLREYQVPKDVIVTTPEDFTWRKTVPGTIERPADREGRVLYERR